MVGTRRSTRLQAVAETPSPTKTTPAPSTAHTSQIHTDVSSGSTPETTVDETPIFSSRGRGAGSGATFRFAPKPVASPIAIDNDQDQSSELSDEPEPPRITRPRLPTRTRSSTRLQVSQPKSGPEPQVQAVPPSDDGAESSVAPTPAKKLQPSSVKHARTNASRPRQPRRCSSPVKSEFTEPLQASGSGEKTFEDGDTTEDDDVEALLQTVPVQKKGRWNGTILAPSALRGRASTNAKTSRIPKNAHTEPVNLSPTPEPVISSSSNRTAKGKGKRKYKSEFESEFESVSDEEPLAKRAADNKPLAAQSSHQARASAPAGARSNQEWDDDDSDDSDFEGNDNNNDNEEEDDDDDFEEVRSHGIAASEASDSGRPGPRGSYAEETRYETAKQRERRLRSRKPKKTNQTRYDQVRQRMLPHHPELSDIWSDLASEPVRSVVETTQPEGMTIKLLPFQLEGIHWLINQEKSVWGGGILADEMGMGKTIQMIALFMSDIKQKKGPVLVIAPTVAIMQWRNEINKYTPGMNVLMWHGLKRERDADNIRNYDVVLTSYQTMERSFSKQEKGMRRKGELIFEPSPLHQTYWHRIILDEAHNIKERATNMAKAAFELKGDYRWCLSGTPLQNRVGELYSMIRFLGADPYAFYFCLRCECKSLHWSFSDRRSCDQCGHTPMHHTCFWNSEILKPIQRGGVEEGEGRDAFRRLHTLLNHIMLRRTKLERADDMGLPPRTVMVRRDNFNEEEMDLYESLYKDTTRKFSTYLNQGTVLNNYSNIFTLLTRMRQMANHPDLVLRSQTGMQQHLLADDAAQNNRVCRICMDVAEDPILSRCRHVFCRMCIREYLETEPGTMAQHSHDCPYCHATIAIDLEQEALTPPVGHDLARQGILSRLDMDQWRSSTKIEALVEELVSVRREDSTIKSLVFSQFTNFLDLIAFRLQRSGFSICRLEGSMTPEARDKTIKHFQNNTQTTVLLLSLKAGGVALNLVEASRVYLMDPWWNPAVETQAMDRIHRIGQHRPIVVKRMIIENSIESRILILQEKKSLMVEAAIGKDDSAMGRLSVSDLQFLFTL